ncbi:MAG: UDP-3-O-[3-hydroxymyristoyl] N-acetylglucosamine deacetylase [Planctomycetia bacterium]|nr:UDP-3-O-[3-hydroxymyristoyl] N-acetylglucosamine deacetylase [Planctomycetia bacterium]
MLTTTPRRSQRTVRRPVAVAGRGYWSGRDNRVEMHPAPAGTGVVFVRADLGVPVRIPAWIGSRVDATSRTNLAASAAGGQVHMVEHVLSALAGLGVDCCVVRVHGEEMPGLDGSSRAFVEAIDSVGVQELGAPVEPLEVTEVVRVGDASAWIEASPPRFEGLSVDYTLDYGPGPIGRQSLSLEVTPDSYRGQLAAARTFISAADAERLRADGLGLAVAPDQLLVFGPDGPVGNTLRWADECVRHKVLDVVGDLSLAGRPIHAHVRAHRSGHRLNAELVERLLGRSRLRASA